MPDTTRDTRPCPDCGVTLAPPPREHADGCLVSELFVRLGRKDLEIERLREELEDTHLALIEARNPGINIDEVRGYRRARRDIVADTDGR